METKTNQALRLRLAGLCGLLSFFILMICIGLSIQYTSWFSWTENWLSELAGSFGETPIWSARGLPAIVFNGGLILSGIIGLLFSMLMRKSQLFKEGLGRFIPALISIDMLAMCSCGIFPVTTGKMHTWCSFASLGLIPVILLFIGFEIKRLYGKKWWWFTNLFCGIMLLSFGVFAYMPSLYGLNRAIAEMILILSIFTVIIAISVRLLDVYLSLKKLPKRATSPHVLYNKKLFRLPTSKG